VGADSHTVRNADKNHEGKKHGGELQRPGEAAVENITQHHLQEGQPVMAANMEAMTIHSSR
jgi:hypothetical protein